MILETGNRINLYDNVDIIELINKEINHQALIKAESWFRYYLRLDQKNEVRLYKVFSHEAYSLCPTFRRLGLSYII